MSLNFRKWGGRWRREEDEDEYKKEMEEGRKRGGGGNTPTKKNQEVVNKYTLLFTDKKWEAEYNQEHINRYLFTQRIGLGSIVGFMGMCTVFKIFKIGFYTGGFYDIFTLGDLAMTIWIGVIHLLMWLPPFYPYVLEVVAVGLGGWAVSLMYYELIPGITDYGVSWGALVICTLSTTIRVKFWMSALVSAMAYIALLIMTFIIPDAPWYVSFSGSFTLVLVSVLGIHVGYQIEKQFRTEMLQKKIMELEDKKAKRTKLQDERILQNIFPKTLMEKLKFRQQVTATTTESSLENNNTIGDAYDCVTVLLCDIVGFTILSSKITPQQVVTVLNSTFTIFDIIMENNKLEKVRTIGDAYLCVGNMTIPLENHQEMMVDAGFRILACLHDIEETHGVSINFRVGIASGPIVAGVTGLTKWNYDIFGDTVSHAALMEKYGTPGRLLITQAVYDALKNNPNFTCEANSPDPVDENGVEVLSYFINDRRSHNSANLYSSLDLVRSASETSSDQNFLPTEWAQGEILDDEAVERIVNSKYYQSLRKDLPETPKQSAKSRLSIYDFTKQDGTYSNEHLQKEMDAIQMDLFTAMKRLGRLDFMDPTFEKDFWAGIAESYQRYSARLTLLIITLILVFLIQDLCLDLKTPGVEMWVFYAIIIVMFGMIYFVTATKWWFFRPYSEYFVTAVLCVCGVLLILQIAYDETSAYHYHRPLAYLFANTSIPVLLIAGASIPQIAVGTYLTNRSNPIDDLPTVLALYPTILALFPSFLSLSFIYWVLIGSAFFSNYFLAKSLRIGFLMTKMIRNDLAQQQSDKERTKLLLLNILPEQIVPRLKPGTHYVADLFENATIIVLAFLNEMFCSFDNLTYKCGLEKIKTINSTYMVASGIPITRKDHCAAAITLSLHMYRAFSDLKQSSPSLPRSYLANINLRIGIASGAVVAGIIGRIKYSYDCWSDATNTASRMESSGLEGHIQITQDVYDAVQESGKFPFVKRGTVDIKGKGWMTTYLLNMQSHLAIESLEQQANPRAVAFQLPNTIDDDDE